MSALAMRTGSVNLGQGFPDVDGPPEVIAAAVRALESGANQYAPGIGVPVLRQAIARHQQRHYGLEIDPDTQVVVTTGCTEGIAAAVLGLVDPGDEVVVLEPYYDSYVAVIQMAGGVRRPVTLRAPDFRLDVDELRAAVTARTRFVLLNSPHNPTGTVLTRDELAGVAEVAIEHDLVVVTDEVYEHLTFTGHDHVPIATLPGMAERTLTLSSAGKSYSFTGLEGGLGDRPGRPGRRAAGRQAVADLHLRRPAAARRGDRAGRAPGLPGHPRRGAGGEARPALQRPGEGRSAWPPAVGHLLRDLRHQPPRLARRDDLLPGPARPGRRGGHPDPAVLRRPGRRPPAGPLGLLQGALGDRGGPQPAGFGRPGC